jgi:hypothetical protein
MTSGVAIGLIVDVWDGDDVGLEITTPLSQINFLPDLTHVYFLSEAIEVNPTFVQGTPVFTAPDAVGVNQFANKMKETRRAIALFKTSPVD